MSRCLDRPLHPAVVVTAIQAALRARARQYELRDVLVELHRARTEAERANLLKDEFLATLSHELRTPLNAILGWVSMLRQGHIAPEQVPRVLQMVERNAQAQAQLIADVLDMSRIVTGQLRLHVAAVPLARVVKAAIETIRPAAEAKNIEIISHIDDDRVAVNADAERLRQVFWNLLTNAVRFTPRSGRVSVTVARNESCVDVVVADTGIGMTAEFLPFAFDRFRQGDQSFSRTQGGLGLGLSIVKHVVQLHGGEVTARSEGVNRGTVFTIRLPVAGMAAPDEENPVDRVLADVLARDHADFTGRTILVVEDDDATRELLVTMFDRCGARAHGAESARAAIQEFDREVPSLVLADISMPEEDGLSLVRRIRDRAPERGGTVPVVALSASRVPRIAAPRWPQGSMSS
jgi:signal transduction histidine kinase